MKRKRFLLLSLMLGLILVLSGCFDDTYMIQGRVVDEKGNDMSGVKIVASGGISATVQTGSDGTFQILNAKGKVTVTPQLDGYAFSPPSKTFDSAPVSAIRFTGARGETNINLKVNVTGNGTVTVYPQKDLYLPGTTVTLTPNPEAGTIFSHWNGDLQSEESPTTITMNTAKTINAVFVDADQVIEFKDPYFEKAVRENIGKPLGLILTDEVTNVDTLNASIEQIQSLEGIENLAALRSLDVSKAKVSDITPLAGLTNMEILDLSSNQVDSLSALGQLTNLHELNLANNKISRVNNMIWLSYKNLKTLDLGGNMISDFTSLYRLTDLERLSLNDNQITSIVPLTELAKAQTTPLLREVDLSGNQISVLEQAESLQNLVNLEKLDLSRNLLTDIGPIVWLQQTNLTDLNLSENPLGSLNPLVNMTNLESLDLSKTGLSDLTALAELTNLKALKLNDNQISDLSPLVNLPLERLYLHNNSLDDITPLLELTDTLQEITLMGNDDLNLSTGYPAYEVIEALRNSGVMVRYSFYKNDIPLLNEIGDLVVNENELLEFQVQATDPDGDDLTYTVEGDLAEYFNLSTMTFSWLPGYFDAGVYAMRVTVSDGEADVYEDFTITVNNVNRPPVLSTIGDKEVKEQDTLSFTVQATDPDAENLVYTATSDQQWLADLFNPNNRTFTWKPGWFDAGQYTLTITVTDVAPTPEESLSVSETIQITVLNNNRMPNLNVIGNKTVQETNLLEFTILATDQDNEDVFYRASGDLTEYFDEATGTFSWTPTYDDAGEYFITFYASDGDLEDQELVKITVTNLDRYPEWVQSIPSPQVYDERTEIVLQIAPYVVDPDNDPFEFSFTTTHPSIMNSATMDRATGEFRWTPVMEDIGTRMITFKAVANNVTISQTVEFTINDVEFPPQIIDIGPLEGYENSDHTIVVNAEEWDGDTMTFTATGAIVDRFTIAGNTFTWKPTYEENGSYPVTFTVEDSNGFSSSQAVTLVIHDVNRPPVLTNTQFQYTVEEQQPLTFVLGVSDPDGNAVTVTAISSTGIDQFYTDSTKTFSWTPDFNDAGVYTITFKLSDGKDFSMYRFDINVTNKDRIPVWLITDNPWNSGKMEYYEYSDIAFTVKARDYDNEIISYSFSPDLPGATIDPASGLFTWSPQESDIGAHDITFIAKAGTGEGKVIVPLEILNKEFAPVLEPIGNQVVNEGEELRFRVFATDKDTDQPIEYMILKKTSTAIDFNSYLDTTAHEFVWTPGYDDQGVYSVEVVTWNQVTPSLQTSEDITITVVNTPQFVITQPIDPIDPNMVQTIDADLYNATTPYVLNITTADPVADKLTNITASGSAIDIGAAYFDYVNQTGTLTWSKENLKKVINQDLTVTFTLYCDGKTFNKTINFHVNGTKLAGTLQVSNVTVTEGDSLTTTLSIQNVGNTDTTSFKVNWELQKSVGGQWGTYATLDPAQDIVPGLTSGAFATDITKTIDQTKTTTSGSYRVFVTIDPEGVAGGPYTVVPAGYTVQPPKYTLFIDTETLSTGSGEVSRDPLMSEYTSGTTVYLQAKSASDSYFVGWSSNVLPDPNYQNDPTRGMVTVTSNTTVKAQFDKINLPKKLAFLSTRDSAKGELYVLYGDGTVARLTNNDLEELNYTWSPNGQAIVFEARDSNTGQTDLYYLDIGYTPRRLTYHTGSHASFAPSGNKIVYQKEAEGTSPQKVMVLDVSRDDSSALPLVTIDKNLTRPKYSPVGSIDQYSTAYFKDGQLTIRKYDNLNGTSYRDLTSINNVTNYAWLADGSGIVYETNNIIRVVHFQANDSPITDIGYGKNPKVNPNDSSRIYYEDNGSINYVTSDLSGSFAGMTPLMLSLGTGLYSSGLTLTGGLDPDIAYVYGTSPSNNEIYYKPPGVDNPIKLTNNTANDYLPKWAP